MTIMNLRLLSVGSLLLPLLLSRIHQVSAFPQGAGACPAGAAAVGGSHVSEDATTGSLQDGGFGVFLNNVPLAEAKPTSFRIGVMEPLELTATTATPFRGFLIRLGFGGDVIMMDLTQALQPAANETEAQIAEASCVLVEDVGGLTHTNNNDKETVVGTILVDQIVSELQLDVTVVVENGGGISTYYYSNFVLNAVDPTAPQTLPTATTSAPSAATLMNGSPAPTTAPVSNATVVQEPPTGIGVDDGSEEEEEEQVHNNNGTTTEVARATTDGETSSSTETTNSSASTKRGTMGWTATILFGSSLAFLALC